MSWKIAAWSREAGRGTVSGLGTVEFDAAIADVDDFRIGEEVEVRLERAGESWKVLRIWPKDPRFKGPTKAGPVPAVDPDKATQFERVLHGLALGEPACLRGLADGVLSLEIQGSGAYADPVVVAFGGVSYLEAAVELDPAQFRLSTEKERAYLATRTEISAGHVSVTIVDDDRRFHFIVASTLALTSP